MKLYFPQNVSLAPWLTDFLIGIGIYIYIFNNLEELSFNDFSARYMDLRKLQASMSCIKESFR